MNVSTFCLQTERELKEEEQFCLFFHFIFTHQSSFSRNDSSFTISAKQKITKSKERQLLSIEAFVFILNCNKPTILRNALFARNKFLNNSLTILCFQRLICTNDDMFPFL